MIGEKILEKIRPDKPQPRPEALPVKPESASELRRSVEAAKSVETPKPTEKAGEGSLPVAAPISDEQKQRLQAIDDILADGLGDIFLSLSPAQQQEFKRSGEETVKKIDVLLKQAKVKARKIVDLIRAWLRMIPGVNLFFLEQEAKIKADKIINLRKHF